MSAGQYTLGVALLSVLVGSLIFTATRTRRVLLPMWSGPPALVAELVIGIATVVFVSEMLGTVGAFSRWPLVTSCAVIAGASIVASRRKADARGPLAKPAKQEALIPPRPGTAAIAAAIVIVALVLMHWLQYALGALHTGMREYDTVTYHMPFAARFAQASSLIGLQYIGNSPVSFYPANSELIHAIGILVFRYDILSPLLNVGWFGFALLAGWCIGRPAGLGPATMSATALAVSVQVMVYSQAGTAKNDIAALALLLASVAIWSHARRSRAAILLAAIAGGLAVGTRLNLWASVLAFGTIAIAYSSRGRRISTAAWTALGVVVGGAFWYSRNLFAVGNAFPWFGFKIGGLLNLPSTSPPTDCGQTAVAHYITDPGFIGKHLFPQLERSMGGRWWVIVGLAVAGVGAGLLSNAAPTERALAVVALISGIAYVLTPASAGGAEASCFAFNSRFAVPALALGLIVLPLALGRRGIHPMWPVLLILIALVADVNVPFAPAPAGASIALVGGATAVAFGMSRPVPRPALAVTVGLITVAAAAAGWREQRVYLRDRYTGPELEEPAEGAYVVLRHASHARVAVTGFNQTYPFYGLHSSNFVQLPAAQVGAKFVPYSTCRSWLTALQRGRYDYVVTGQQGTRDSPATAWTRLYPRAREVLAAPPGYTRRGVPWRWQLFRLPPGERVEAAGACMRLASPRASGGLASGGRPAVRPR
jgi:hypothetical protein